MRSTLPTQQTRTNGQDAPLALSLVEADRIRAEFLARELELINERAEARSREFFARLDAQRKNESGLQRSEIEFAI